MVTRNCNNLHTLHLRVYQLEWYSSTFPPLQPRKTDRKGNTYNMASSSSTSLYRDKTFASIRDFTQVNTRDNRRHNIPKEKGKAERLKSAAGPLACFTNKTKKGVRNIRRKRRVTISKSRKNSLCISYVDPFSTERRIKAAFVFRVAKELRTTK